MTSIGRRARAIGAAALLTCAAGGAGAATAAAADPAGLVAFSSCEQLLGYAQEHVPPPVRYDASRPIPPTAPMPAASPVAGGEATGDDASGEPDFSSTNVQEEGVDEPDTVKTDGRRIFTIADAKLIEVDGRAGAPSVLGTLRLEGVNQQLLLWRDRALVIAETSTPTIGIPAPAPAPTPQGDTPVAKPALSPAYYAPTQTLLTELDLTLPGRPRIVRNFRVDGSYRAARLVGDVVRLVVNSAPRALSDEQARPQVAGWIPSYRVRNRRTRRTATRAVAACTQISHPQQYSGPGLLTVLTIDLAKGLTPADSDSILGSASTVYGAPDALYVATQPSGSGSGTTIHKFVTRAGSAETSYRASGNVPGTLLSQWALSEQDGVLRAASTVPQTWSASLATMTESESFVTTLAERGGGLAEIGRVGGLGKGERIYAVRFIGEVGYVVTFRQTDPLYTLDLSDPARPQLLGELKILGYSAYLHPVGEDLLLGVGQNATDRGQRLGGQVSLFDVSDLRAPKRLATAALPGWSSQVEWDHHAFLYWPRTRLAVIPSEGYSVGGALVGATALRITRADGLQQVGTLAHPAGDGYRGQVTRSVVIGRRLFTLSDDGLLSSDLATLRDDRWLPFA